MPDGLIVRTAAATSKAPHKAENEDAAGCTDRAIWVIDGASRVTPLPYCCGRTTASYVRELSAAIRASVDSNVSLIDVLARAIETVAKDHTNRCASALGGGPTAAVAVARATQDDSLEVFVLGDCTAIVGQPYATAITDRRLHRVATHTRAKIDHLREHDCGEQDQLRTLLLDRQAAEDAARNTPSGFWIAQDDPVAARHAAAENYRIPRSGLTLALTTDGIESRSSADDSRKYSRLLLSLTKYGVIGYLTELRESEASSARPPTRPPDDASAATIVANLS